MYNLSLKVPTSQNGGKEMGKRRHAYTMYEVRVIYLSFYQQAKQYIGKFLG